MSSAVICDMDGLLIDSERTSLACWQQAAREVGRELPEHVFGRWIGRKPEENVALAQEDLGADFPFWQIRERRTELLDELLAAGNMPVKEGALEILQAIRRGGFPLAVATSSATEVAHEFLAQLALLEYVDVVVGGEQVPAGKPAPDIFLKTAQVLGVAARECVVLEDSGPGMRSAAAAGMIVVAVPDLAILQEEERELAHAICTDLHEALPIVLALLAPSDAQ